MGQICPTSESIGRDISIAQVGELVSLRYVDSFSSSLSIVNKVLPAQWYFRKGQQLLFSSRARPKLIKAEWTMDMIVNDQILKLLT